MSLTSELRNKGSLIRRYIDEEFPDLSDISTRLNFEIKDMNSYDSPHTTNYPHALVGTTIDYRIRAYLTELPHRSGVIGFGLRTLDNVHSITTARGRTIRNPWNKSKGQISANFVTTLVDFITETRVPRRLLNIRDEYRLCRYCVLLARIDTVARVRNPDSLEWLLRVGSKNIDKMLDAAAEPPVIDDIVALSIRYYYRNEEFLRTFKSVVAGQNLSGSKDVCGADFDLIVDQCLFDIKSTIHPEHKTIENLRQLVGYWLLDYDDQFQIRSAAIYFARQGYTARLDYEKDLFIRGRTGKNLRNDLKKLFKRNKGASKNPITPSMV